MTEQAADGALRRALATVVAGDDLSAQEVGAALGEIMDGVADDVRVAAFLTALRMKGETVEELVGAVRAMRARAVRIRPRATRILDTCGTGGDRAGTFNISTAVAFVCAAAGVTVAKHGNRAVSSAVGSADVLEALGVTLELGPEAVTRCIDEIGIGFMFAPHHHHALRYAAPVRRALAFRTMLNLLGPMTNPAGATHQLIGVYARARVREVAEVLGRLGAVRALVVHGSDGLDEITTGGPTHAALWARGEVTELTLDPATLGLERSQARDLAGGDLATNARIVREVLEGEPGPASDVVRLNAGAALWVADEARTLEAGVARATEVLRAGLAWQRLEQLAALTRELAA